MWNPTGNRVMVEVVNEVTELTDSNLILVRNKTIKPETGTVVAVGPGTKAEDGSQMPPRLVPGDKILFSTLAGAVMRDGDKQYKLLEEREVMAKIQA